MSIFLGLGDEAQGSLVLSRVLLQCHSVGAVVLYNKMRRINLGK